MFREPDPPVNSDSDAGQQAVEGDEDTVQVGVPLFLRPPCSHPLALIPLLPTRRCLHFSFRQNKTKPLLARYGGHTFSLSTQENSKADAGRSL